MDQERTQGVAKAVSGSLKEAIGMVTGDTETEAEGTAEKAVATVQGEAGRSEGAVRGATND